jgi:hypothetical protein
VTAPASDTSTATVLPDHAPAAWSSSGPTLTERRYDVGRVDRNHDRLTDVKILQAIRFDPGPGSPAHPRA